MTDAINLINSAILSGNAFTPQSLVTPSLNSASLLYGALNGVNRNKFNALSQPFDTTIPQRTITAIDTLDFSTLEGILLSTNFNTSTNLFSNSALSLYDNSLSLLDIIYAPIINRLDITI